MPARVYILMNVRVVTGYQWWSLLSKLLLVLCGLCSRTGSQAPFPNSAITCSFSLAVESSAVQTLKASAVTTNSAIISWNSVPGATGYRLAWGPTSGDLAAGRHGISDTCARPVRILLLAEGGHGRSDRMMHGHLRCTVTV